MIQLHQLKSYMASYTPLHLLREDYYKRLASSAVVVDGTALVPLDAVANFFMSTEREAMDKEYQHKKLQQQQRNSQDGDYVEKDEKWK